MPPVSKTDFLRRVMRAGASLAGPDVLMSYDAFVRDNVRVAAEALQLGLVRLSRDPDGLGHQVRITPAGRLLALGQLTEAAAALDAGRTPIRIAGPEPEGVLGARLAPGCAPVPLASGLARTNAAEVLRGIATGHLAAEDGYLRPAVPGRGAGDRRGSALGTSTLAARNLVTVRRGGRG